MRQGNLNTKCFSELWIKSKQSTVNLKNTAFISTRKNNSTSNGTSVLSWETRHIEIKLALCAIFLVLSFAGNATILLPLIRFTTTRTVTNFFYLQPCCQRSCNVHSEPALICTCHRMWSFLVTQQDGRLVDILQLRLFWFEQSCMYGVISRGSVLQYCTWTEYKLWKTTSLARRICSLTWIVAFILNLSINIPNYHIDIGNVSSGLYIKTILQKIKPYFCNSSFNGHRIYGHDYCYCKSS